MLAGASPPHCNEYYGIPLSIASIATRHALRDQACLSITSSFQFLRNLFIENAFLACFSFANRSLI